jgi:DNA-binding transcriptional ArsR family regulator
VSASVFEAVADPTRRRLLELLADGERSAGELARSFAISRPAISRHLRILRETGLVRWRGDAQRRIYALDAGPLGELDEWLDRYRHFWPDAIDRLAAHLDDAPSKGER